MNTRNYNIDIIKSVAIVSVILLHSLSNETLFSIGAPFHIWQTVPVFMILVGYNSSNSYERRELDTLKELYAPSYLINKLNRLIFPFLLVWLLEIAIYFLVLDGLNFREVVVSLFSGGWGHGSYYVPLIIQATLVMPIIYVWMKKNLAVGIVGMFVVSIGVEYFSLYIGVSEEVYRLLLFRYLFALSLGTFLALNRSKVDYKWLLPLSLVSLTYITAVNYYGWTFIMEPVWLSQHAPAYFWTFLLVVLGLNVYQIKNEHHMSKIFVRIGKASYHIFLVQMVYFWTVGKVLPDFSEVTLSLINMTLCLFFGLLFYEFEKAVKKIANKEFEKNTVA